MSRRISLPIGGFGTSDHDCGDCRALYSPRRDMQHDEWHGWRCRVYGPIESPPGDGQLRHPLCLTAEREHAAMERDARLGKAVRRAVDAHGGSGYLATHAGRASASSFDSARILEAIAAALRAEEEVRGE